MILHYFSSTGWQEWDVQGQPLIRSGMPVLVAEAEAFRTLARRLKSWAETV